MAADVCNHIHRTVRIPMSTARTCRHTLIATALAVAAIPSLAADRAAFSRTVFIGDSLSDSGFFRPLLVATAGSPAAVLGRFTTNPGWVWSEHLARYYGTDASPNGNGQNGDNYAAGGAETRSCASRASAG